MAYSTRAEHIEAHEDHHVAWAIGKLILAAVVTGSIIMGFAGASYILGTKPPQSTQPPATTDTFKR